MLSYRRVKYYDEKNYDDLFLCTLDQIYSGSDKLARNYRLDAIDRMIEYGYMVDEEGDIAYMAGIQPFGDGLLRCESRTWINPKYRTIMWNPPDNYELTMAQCKNHSYSLMFKSREKSPAGHLRSQKLNSFFAGWVLYPEKIELGFKNNWQWIMYKGNENEIKKLIYKT